MFKEHFNAANRLCVGESQHESNVERDDDDDGTFQVDTYEGDYYMRRYEDSEKRRVEQS